MTNGQAPEFQTVGEMTRIGSWIDDECFYVTIVDGPKFALLLGPFRTEQECREWAYVDSAEGAVSRKHLDMIRKAGELDPKSAFYGFGMTKMANGHRQGVMNKYFDI